MEKNDSVEFDVTVKFVCNKGRRSCFSKIIDLKENKKAIKREKENSTQYIIYIQVFFSLCVF